MKARMTTSPSWTDHERAEMGCAERCLQLGPARPSPARHVSGKLADLSRELANREAVAVSWFSPSRRHLMVPSSTVSTPEQIARQCRR